MAQCRDASQHLESYDNEQHHLGHDAAASVASVLRGGQATTTTNASSRYGYKYGGASMTVYSSSSTGTLEYIPQSNASSILAQYGHWMIDMSTSPDVAILQNTREYHDMIHVLDRLRHVHRMHVVGLGCNNSISNSNSRNCERSDTPRSPLVAVSATISEDRADDDEGGGGRPSPIPPQSPMLLNDANTRMGSVQDSGMMNTETDNVDPVLRSRFVVSASQRQLEQPPTSTTREPLVSFLQFRAADELVLRILSFLECNSLIQCTKTCWRLRALVWECAQQRSRDIAMERQLSSPMQLLRAHEQLEGINVGCPRSGRSSVPHMRIPTLLLHRRIVVTGSGDPEYNGLYFCTGSNGNGFVFTKPREPNIRVTTRRTRPDHDVDPTIQPATITPMVPPLLAVGTTTINNNNNNNNTAVGRGMRVTVSQQQSHYSLHRAESEIAQPGQLLRCIIAKRFSNETILWYLSKEVLVADEPHQPPNQDRTGRISPREPVVGQVFSFWAKLMVIGDASPDICRYPSQTSILTRHNQTDGWQTLATTRTLRPPVVELLD